MRVVHLNEFLAAKGGLETYLLSLIGQLESRGVEQSVVYARGDAGLVRSSALLPELSQYGFSAERRGYDAARRVFADLKPDLVHIHGLYNIGAVRAALDVAPTVITTHDYRYVCPASTFFFRRTRTICQRSCGPMCFVNALTRRCMTPRPRPALHFYRRVRFFARHADRFHHVIAPSGYTKQRVVQGGFRDEQVSVIPYFCPINVADAPRPIPAQPLVTFMGRLTPSKGWDVFVRAMRMLPPEVRGVIIGSVDEQRGRELRQNLQREGVADRMEICSWAGRDEIRARLEASSVLVFPSLWPETLGIVGLEAMACGVPVVASDVGGVREWLQHERSGLLVPPGDPVALAEAVGRIVADAQLNADMGAAGQRIIREKFQVDRHIDALMNVYRASVAA